MDQTYSAQRSTDAAPPGIDQIQIRAASGRRQAVNRLPVGNPVHSRPDMVVGDETLGGRAAANCR
jgi:hypothetical protein